MMHLRPPHPFPARMAPELAVARLRQLRRGAIVLDPMSGSGTVLRHAAEAGHTAIGFDLDPLATLMAKVWTTPINTTRLRELGMNLIHKAESSSFCSCRLDWQKSRETTNFIRFWFGFKQVRDLRRLAYHLHGMEIRKRNENYRSEIDCLRLALSRIIVTKDSGASLARDVSHSRPHKVMESSGFDVLTAYTKCIARLAQEFDRAPPTGNVTVRCGDARRLSLESESVDYVLTSPPYLNAIDYMRGHRLALIWLGYSLDSLRATRSTSIGAERAAESGSAISGEFNGILQSMGNISSLPLNFQRIILRYACDIYAVLSEIRRVTKPRGHATLVVGNSCLKGVFIHNSEAVKKAASMVGLQLLSEDERILPQHSRYLPPPDATMSTLGKRMKTEVILEFVKP